MKIRVFARPGLSFVRSFPFASPTPSARNAATDLRKVRPRRTLQEWLVPFVCRAAPYGFGEVRVATLALLIFTALSGSRSCGIVSTKFSDQLVTLRSSPTVFADTPVPTSASTCILAGKPPRAMSSAAMLLHLYRGIGYSLIARLLNSQPVKAILSRDMRRSEDTGRSKGSQDNKLDVVPNAWRLGRSNSAILPRASRDKISNGTLVGPSLRQRHEGVAARPGARIRTCHTCGFKLANDGQDRSACRSDLS